MAVRDHSLDDKITRAAVDEFLKHGFQGASLHKIAKRAGITTGALYTRYKNKDALFCSLVEEVICAIKVQSEPLRKRYDDVQQSKDAAALLEVISQERKTYLDILFSRYDECVLFFCRSAGSSIEAMLSDMMERKASETISFLKSMAKVEVDFDGVDMIIAEQLHFYRCILERGYSRERAISCMETVGAFLEAGWIDLLGRIM